MDGNALAASVRADVARRAATLKAKGNTPGLAVLLVGENPASQVSVLCDSGDVGQPFAQGVRDTPVSYTHLTLPTKRIV